MPTSTSKYQYITCDTEKCVGCQLCEYICSYTKTGEFNTFRSRIRTVRAKKILITAVACRTCEDAPCVIACPRDALSQDPDTGVIRVDANRCDGCAWCIEACDFGARLRSATCARTRRKALSVSSGAPRKRWNSPRLIAGPRNRVASWLSKK